MTQPEAKVNFSIECPAGESIFYRALAAMIPKNWPRGLQEGISEYASHVKDLDDERAYVVVGALCVEHCLDEMVSALLPSTKYGSFKRKTDIIRAFRLIPSRILDDCGLIAEMRNHFAHDLECKTLSNQKPERLQRVDDALRRYDPSYPLDISAKERCGGLVEFVCVALTFYTTHVECMREFIDDARFLEELERFCAKK